MSAFSLVCTDENDAALRAALTENPGVEGAAYVLFRRAKIASDPWDRVARTKLLFREIVPIAPTSASDKHVTWRTDSFVAMLQRVQQEDLVLGIAHSHPAGFDSFSEQDNENEQELCRTGCNRNGESFQLVSVLLTAGGALKARVWQYPKHETAVGSILVIGERIVVHSPSGLPPSSTIFARQALAFGAALTGTLKKLRIGIIGCGGTGSATAPLLARAGAGHLLLIDDDIVDVTNLNRLHGATQEDADAMRLKVDVVAREIARMGVGCRVQPMRGWVSDIGVREALKACDVIFCCTDDHAGRVFLNRLAYFYLMPVFDMGLAMAIAKDPAAGMADISSRITTIMPPDACLLCRGAVDIEWALSDDLRRQNPEEFERRKREAYIRGGGNPSPAVVTFTTETACMAVNELLNRIVGFRKRNMGSEIRRRFLYSEDRATSASPRHACPVCSTPENWGLGDVDPFLDLVS